MKTLNVKYEIKASVEKVWQALTDPKVIAKWGAGPAKMDSKVGTKFSLWGGDVSGKNLEVVPNKLLKQEWKEKEWDTYSTLTFALSEKDGETKVEIHQTDIPDSEVKAIESGWEEYYMGPLKKLVEK